VRYPGILREEIAKFGLWLFRRRSFLALAAIPIAVGGFRSFTYIAQSHELTKVWQMGCFVVSISGLVLRAFTVGYVPKGTSSRNTCGPGALTLNTTGMYSLVRHPLYLGNYLAVLGCLLFFHRVWIVVAGTAVFAILYESIILSEEAFLRNRFGDAFESWARATPTWIPRLRGWKTPGLPFSWRTVLNREYTGLFVVCAIFSVFDLAGDWVVEGRWQFDGWSALLVFGAFLYSALRTLKRRTKLLDVDGR
jgi:protein-S-isoprenylcysteine O-methyltransferase Ste14